jgi:geranylgeranyl diphosphate synthase type II
MLSITEYKEVFLTYLQEELKVKNPVHLYHPVSYILELGGKRMRPVLVMLGVSAFQQEVKKALPAAAAIEVFHNFTLLHDDIMDAAPLRRGQLTVHEKWDTNTAILSGDVMMILASQFLEKYEGAAYKRLTTLFNRTAIEVCEGQQYDMDFEKREEVSVEEYIEMIRLKTSVLVAAALKMGAIIAESSEEEAQKMYDFGLHLGIAFQLQDDYLDVYGDAATFGKQVGGDIIENKKTYLYIQALKNVNAEHRAVLLDLYSQNLEENTLKIEKVKAIFNANAIDELTKVAIRSYTQKAFQVLESMNIAPERKAMLQKFGENLMVRKV